MCNLILIATLGQLEVLVVGSASEVIPWCCQEFRRFPTRAKIFEKDYSCISCSYPLGGPATQGARSKFRLG